MATEAKTPEAAHSPLDDPSLSREERQQHILMAHRNMRAQIAQLSQKIAELDSERGEHALVMNTIKDLDPQRKCFRLISGVLVERTVGEVLPAVQRNQEQITKVIEELSKQLKDKEHQMQEFQIKYSVRPENMGAPPAGGNA